MNILYLRTDFWFGLKAGGSVAHTAGVIGGMSGLGHRVAVLSTDLLPGVTPETVTVHVVKPWLPVTVPKLRALGPPLYNLQLLWSAGKTVSSLRPDVIYHRHSAFSCAGALLSRRSGCPLVLEVNALILRWAQEQRDVWTQRVASLAALMERFVFNRTSLFVAISAAVRDQLLEEGIPAERILVNPNGVDPQAFRPDLSAAEVRMGLGLENRKVVGFIGTFGNWHGVECLAEAIPRVVRARPEVHFLLIGEGPLRPRIQASLASAGALAHVTFAGLVPQEQAPRYLAACDLFVSPHTRPRTGRFIGSPTKLFEYMAMGRAIVASDLDQIGEVLEDGHTALLVEPGDAEALAGAILRLVENPEQAARLGRNARERVLATYTWEHNARRLMDAVERYLAPHGSASSVRQPAGSGHRVT